MTDPASGFSTISSSKRNVSLWHDAQQVAFARQRTGSLRLGPWSRVARPTVAAFMLRCLSDGTHIRQAPMIAN